jgi:hypothetical protein
MGYQFIGVTSQNPPAWVMTVAWQAIKLDVHKS